VSDTPLSSFLSKEAKHFMPNMYVVPAFALEQLERENAALRADIHAHEQINRQLIEDKRRLDWLLTDDGGFWVNWMYDKDEWMPELKASRDAIDACRNGRIGREKP
jgi:hypothetical protein